MVLVLDWDMVLDDASDDHTPEVVITSSEKSKRGGQTKKEDMDCQMKTDNELQHTISKKKDYMSTREVHNKGPGSKLEATPWSFETDFKRRDKIHGDKDSLKSEETIQLSDQSDDGASHRKDRRYQKSVASPSFANLFSKKIDENKDENAFEKELSFFKLHQGRKSGQNGQPSNSGRSSKQSIFRSKQFQCPTTLADNRRHKNSNSAKTANNSVTSSLQNFYTKKLPEPPSSYHLVDDDIEDPFVSNTTQYAEELSECMRDITVYYPSRDDRDPIEVTYADMECLAPEACLSSSIMNFYIRYLQQTSSENKICNYHFFNTYFYNKLKKLNYSEDSFLKFRKWWKGVNIFEKAYILLPLHESAHWSLGIICIPSKEDECGPIVLHLDSLGLHDSSLIFHKIRRFLKEEFRYLTNSDEPLDRPITGEIWENLDHRITVPQQRNSYDCGLFVLSYMERFIREAPDRLTEKDLSMFGKQWFLPEEASNLRWRIHNLLVQEFKIAKDILSSKS